MATIGIRVTNSFENGKGHLIRCLTIREHLRSKIIWFLDCRNFNSTLIPHKDIVKVEKNKESVEKTLNYIKKKKVDLLIIDTYSIKNYIKDGLAKEVILVSIQDHLSKINAKLVVVPHPINIIKEKISSKNFLVGLKFAPVHNKEKTILNDKFSNKKIKLLLSMGYYDSKGVSLKVLKALKKINNLNLYDISVTVVLGKKSPHFYAIKKQIKFLCNYELISPSFIDYIKIQPDLAIGALGISHLERLSKGIPSIIITQNKIQKGLIKSWKKYNCCLFADNSITSITDNLKLILKSNKLRYNIGLRAMKLVDGSGPNRIAKEIEKLI